MMYLIIEGFDWRFVGNTVAGVEGGWRWMGMGLIIGWVWDWFGLEGVSASLEDIFGKILCWFCWSWIRMLRRRL